VLACLSRNSLYHVYAQQLDVQLRTRLGRRHGRPNIHLSMPSRYYTTFYASLGPYSIATRPTIAFTSRMMNGSFVDHPSRSQYVLPEDTAFSRNCAEASGDRKVTAITEWAQPEIMVCTSQRVRVAHTTLGIFRKVEDGLTCRYSN